MNTAETEAQPGHQLFWKSCLVLVPLAAISALIPYAQVMAGTTISSVYILREYPALTVIAILLACAVVGFAVLVLRKPRQTLKWVITVTCLAALFATLTAAEAGRSNRAPFSVDGTSSTAIYADGGHLPYTRTAGDVPELSVRRHGPWMPLAALALAALALIGIYCCIAAWTVTGGKALAISSFVAVPFLSFLLIVFWVSAASLG